MCLYRRVAAAMSPSYFSQSGGGGGRVVVSDSEMDETGIDWDQIGDY